MAKKYMDFCKSGHDMRLPDAFSVIGTKRRCRLCKSNYQANYRSENPLQFAQYAIKRVRSVESIKAQIETARRRRATLRLDGIVYLGGICIDCGYKRHLDALQFDHIPGHGTPNRKAILGAFGWQRMQEELNKCELVCASCHAIRTAFRRAA